MAAREKAIRCFVPTPYWEITAQAKIQGYNVSAEYEKKRIETRKQAETVVSDCKGKTGTIQKVDIRTTHQKPPTPFDVGTLQREAYSLFGYNPRRTLAIAQRLYLDALISYPRTSSQKLPPVIGYKKILNALARKPSYKLLASKLLKQQKLTPRQGTKDDPAHPAIYPTGNLPEKPLKAQEKRVWDLVVRRFMAVFGEDAKKESVKANLQVNGHTFFLKGRRVLEQGWMVYYKPYLRLAETFLPQLKTGDTALMQDMDLLDKFSCPPPRYNPSSLLKKMEELGVGTKATRAEIVQTLYNRRYVVDERIAVTELGFDVIDVLDSYVPAVVSAMLTKELEDKMEKIQNGATKRETVIEEVVEELEPQLLQFKENEEAIGNVLTKAITKAKTQELTVGKCPNCKTGQLAVITSRKTKKRFIGCTNYFDGLCQTSFPLPQRGTIKPSKGACKSCGWPTVLVWLRGKKPWNLCFNLGCSSHKRRIKS